jgi:hypothetical protein
MGFPYVAVVIMLIGVGHAGAVLGGYFVFTALQKAVASGTAVLVLGGLADLMIILEVGFLRFFFAQWRTCRRGEDVPRTLRWWIPVLLLTVTTAVALTLWGLL